MNTVLLRGLFLIAAGLLPGRLGMLTTDPGGAFRSEDREWSSPKSSLAAGQPLTRDGSPEPHPTPAGEPPAGRRNVRPNTPAERAATRSPHPAGSFKGGAVPRSQIFEGTVVMVVPSRVTLSRQGCWTTFLVPDNAMIRVNSAEALLEEVLPGQFASVVGEQHGTELVARVIDAKRQY